MIWLTNLCYAIGFILYLPRLIYEMVVLKKNRSQWRQRFGTISPPPKQVRRVWVHGVSLGEINASRLIVEKLTPPDGTLDVVISSTTDTGTARAQQLYGPDRVFRYPLDFSWVIARVLRRVRPDVIVLMELELWPNLMTLAKRQQIPVVVANGRLTERSHRRLRRLGFVARPMFRALRWVGAQDTAIAGRFASLGTHEERIEVTGSVKWDTVTLGSEIDGSAALARAMGYQASIRLLVCGSTGATEGYPEEERTLVEVYRRLKTEFSNLHLVLVPRKPERFDAVAKMIGQTYPCLRRSARPDGVPPEPLDPATTAVSLGDTMGELRKFYALADVVLIGRSLVPMGGSDPMEAAALGKALVCGPHMENFEAPVAALREADAIRVVVRTGESEALIDGLVRTIEELLQDAGRCGEMGRRAQEVVRSHQGATDRTVRAIRSVMMAETTGEAVGSTPVFELP